MPGEYKMHINGEWVDVLDRPYTGKVFARVATAFTSA
jgi:hypothetical protein